MAGETMDDLSAFGIDPEAPDADDWRALIAIARDAGASEHEIRAGIDNRDLFMIPLRRGLVVGRERITVEEAAARAGVDPAFSLRIWTALGLANDEDTTVSERDVALFEYFKWLYDVMGPDEALQGARTMGAAVSKMADAQVVGVRSMLRAPMLSERVALVEMAKLMEGLLDVVPYLQAAMLVSHRQHLHLADRRYSLWGVEPSTTFTTDCVIGFADIVGSTALGARLGARELDTIVRTFEHRVLEVTSTRLTRLVKLIGDEALFVAGSAREAASIAKALVCDPDLPDLRVGLAAGEVLTRGGDVYGSVVNLAARLVATAAPKQVLVDARTAHRLGPDPAMTVEPLGARELVGFDTPMDVFELVVPMEQ